MFAELKKNFPPKTNGETTLSPDERMGSRPDEAKQGLLLGSVSEAAIKFQTEETICSLNSLITLLAQKMNLNRRFMAERNKSTLSS